MPFETLRNIFLPKNIKIDNEDIFKFTDCHDFVCSEIVL